MGALLAELCAIERSCRGDDLPGNGRDEPPAALGDVQVECLLRGPSEKFWVCTSPSCPEVTACLWAQLSGVRKEEIVFAVTDPKERLTWDHDSFRSYEILRPATPEDPAGGDVIYCVLPAPGPLRDRDMLQRRWQLSLPRGGWAMICQSFHDDAIKAPQPQFIRAFTHLSGYLLRPVGEGLELTVISRCDLGGSIPTWAQNLVRRLAKHKPVAWAKKLGEHCKHLEAFGTHEAAA